MNDRRNTINQTISTPPLESISSDDSVFSPIGTGKVFRLAAYRVNNFRGFKDSGWIYILPLTLFMGDNSSGKTAILQPLEMLASAEGYFGRANPFKDLEGVKDITGKFSDIVLSGEKSFGLSFRLESADHDRIDYNVILSESSDSIYGCVSGISARYGEKEIDLSDYYTTVNLFILVPKNNSDLSISRNSIPRIINKALEDFSESCRWISGNRYSPEREMVLSGTSHKYIGEKGNYAYEILYYLSQISHQSTPVINHWLSAFGYQGYWKMSGSGTNVGSYVLKNKKTGVEINIVDNGYGISQSLPIAVAIETLEKDDTLMVDSPEAFLQTKMQSEMGSLLAEGSKRGTIIAETGSEALLYRIRYLISNGTLPHENVGLFFIWKSESDGTSKCRRISFDPYGNTSNDNDEFRQFFSSAFNDLNRMEMEKIQRMSENNYESGDRH